MPAHFEDGAESARHVADRLSAYRVGNQPDGVRLDEGERLTFAQVLAEELDAIAGNGKGRWDSKLPEAEVYAAIHERAGKAPATAPLAALCLSGGGIRSATFGLGVLQGFARCGLLPQFHYLSTVSGGGYIGSWLTAWIHRKAGDHTTPDPIGRVTQELAGEGLGPVESPIGMGELGVAAEAPTIAQLRIFSNYLAPQAGLLSADLWTLAATILTNVILNWLVLVPALMAALAVPRLLAWAVQAGSPDGAFLPAVVGLIGCVITIAYTNRTPTLPIVDRPSQGKVLVFAIAPIWVAAIALSIAWRWLFEITPKPDLRDHWATALVFGVLVMSVGWAAYRIVVARTRAIGDANNEGKGEEGKRRMPPQGGWMGVELVVYAAVGLLGGFIVWIVAHAFPPGRDMPALIYAVGAPPAFVLSFTLAAAIFVGLASSWMSEQDREWWSRFGAWALISATAWASVSLVGLLLPEWIAGAYSLPLAATATGASGIISILGGLSKKTIFKPRFEAAAPGADPKRRRDGWLPMAVKIALPIFVVLFAVFLSLLTDLLVATHWRGPFDLNQFLTDYLGHGLHVRLVLDGFNAVIIVVASFIAAFASWRVSINKFSLHAMYRNRLIRAYLGASRGKNRLPDPFIGFDTNDDFALCSMQPRAGVHRPLFHVVNMALNLVGGRELAWQERKADSMTASSLHVGTRMLGFRRAEVYGGSSAGPSGKGHPLTLGTAMAISGAAASPNMGYHSSPVLTFLMTLFNARLGWWLGNPGPAGVKRKAYMRESPEFALFELLAEAFGQTDQDHPYVYASDGGHFDNLGLYEMVRRRCRFVVVVDGGADPECEFEDLSAAIRKIRSDMGIPIEVPAASERSIYPRSDRAEQNVNGRMAFSGRIRYSAVDCDASVPAERKERYDGFLIYIKPAFYDGSEPLDVVHYAKGRPAFPHETTADQFFSESQFESYRALGAYAVRLMTKPFPAGGSLDDFRASIDSYVKAKPA